MASDTHTEAVLMSGRLVNSANQSQAAFSRAIRARTSVSS